MEAEHPGKDAFYRVPIYASAEWDAVEHVLTILEDRFTVVRRQGG